MLATILALLTSLAGSPAAALPVHPGCGDDGSTLLMEFPDDVAPADSIPEAQPLGESVLCRGDRADPPDCRVHDPVGSPLPLTIQIPGSTPVLLPVLFAPPLPALARRLLDREHADALAPGHARGVDRPPRA